MLLTGLASATARAQTQSPAPAPAATFSEAERARRLQERDRYFEEANRLAKAGKRDEAAAAFDKKLAIEREVLGDLHEEVVKSLQRRARTREESQEWEKARADLEEVHAIREHQQDRKAWRIADGRRALVDFDRRAAMPPDHRLRLRRADSLIQMAVAQSRQGKYEAAKAAVLESLGIRKEILGEDHLDYAISLSSLARLHLAMGDYARAEPLCRQITEIAKKALGEDHPQYASSLNNLATLYRMMGDHARAEPLARQALEIQKTATGENHLEYATTLHNLALLYEAMGDYARAEPLARQALELTKKALGVHHPDYAQSLDNLAGLHLAMGDYARAEPLRREALELTKKALGESHPEHATSLNNLAMLYWAMGDYARAEPLSRQALEITKKALGEGHPQYATNLANLALLYQAMGDYARAEPLARQALEIRKKALGEGHPEYATALGNLAELYRAMGDFARAEMLCRQALETTKKALGEGHPQYAANLGNLATLYWAMGDYARAEPLCRQVRDIWKNTLGVDHPHYATSLTHLALLYQAMGDHARAEPLLRQALEIRKKALGESHPEYATSLNNLAGLYQALGDHARAEPLFRQALELTKKALGEGHPHYASRLNNLAGLYWAMGDDARARLLLSESLEKGARFLRTTSAGLGERQRLRLFANQRRALDAFLTVTPKDGPGIADVYRHVLEWKGAAEAQQAEDRLVRDQPALRPILDQLAPIRARLAHLALTTPTRSQRASWRKQFDALRDQKENLEADLARRSAEFRREEQARQLGPEELAAALPDEAALIDLVGYAHYSLPAGGKGRFQMEPRLIAFVVRRGKPVALVPLGAARPIEEAVIAWRRALKEHNAGARDAAAVELGRRVWEPLRPQLGDARTVLVAPDGRLSAFPFAALPGRKPGSYLVEDLAIGYVASGRQAVEALTRPQGPVGSGLLAAGNIDFQADPGQSGPSDLPTLSPAPVLVQRGGFSPLPATGPEATAARDLFHKTFADQPADLLTGAGATEAELKHRLDGGRWRVVHLATHGFFESPARIAALRAAVRRDEPFAPLAPVGKDDEDLAFALTPMLRSGVVLAGGGRAPDAAPVDLSPNAPTRDDGILTAEEVQALDLRGCELVVLSACETGLGQLEYGQGILGLQRAFQAAGARAVVASLWKVDDAATGVLMERFYTNLWTKKLPRLEALRQAQLDVLNDPGWVKRKRGLAPIPETPPGGGAPPSDRPATRSDPALWAAFVLGGDGR
jgi:CHAT domain-containing protein/Tfp pilus assembly protein PilF